MKTHKRIIFGRPPKQSLPESAFYLRSGTALPPCETMSDYFSTWLYRDQSPHHKGLDHIWMPLIYWSTFSNHMARLIVKEIERETA